MGTPKHNSENLSDPLLADIKEVRFDFTFQQMWKCKYIETSAKNGTNVTELFEELLKLETSRQLSLQPIEEVEKKKKLKEKCSLM